MNKNAKMPRRTEKDEKNTEQMREAEIDANVEDSFPASDSPSWTLGTNHRAEATTRKSDDAEREDGEI